jgi:hypothetical protein
MPWCTLVWYDNVWSMDRLFTWFCNVLCILYFVTHSQNWLSLYLHIRNAIDFCSISSNELQQNFFRKDTAPWNLNMSRNFPSDGLWREISRVSFLNQVIYEGVSTQKVNCRKLMFKIVYIMVSWVMTSFLSSRWVPTLQRKIVPPSTG